MSRFTTPSAKNKRSQNATFYFLWKAIVNHSNAILHKQVADFVIFGEKSLIVFRVVIIMKIEIGKDFPQHFKASYPEEFELISHFEVTAGITMVLFAITTWKENGKPNVCFHSRSCFHGR